VTEHSYSPEHYHFILRRAAEAGLPVVRTRDLLGAAKPDRFLLIRHDVDITPWAALEMANIEATHGVATSYYFRLHADTYNLLTPDSLAVVRGIAAQGHEVGLHYEPGYFLQLGRDPVGGVRGDIQIFEEFLGERTVTIAQHQPAEGPRLAHISSDHACAYDPEFVRAIPYFADSGFHWREGCICTKLDAHPRIHTLIHPHSWMRPPGDWRDALRSHANDLAGRLRAGMETHIQSVESYLARRDRLDRERESLYDREP
jgi:hypothetical protein